MSAPITITGRLGADPELKIGASGTPVVRLRVVTNGRKKVGDAWEDADTSWWSVVAFKAVAENTAASLSKGDQVVVIGKAKESTWETAEGDKRSRIEVVADTIAVDLARVTAKPVKGDRYGGSTTGPADDAWASGGTWGAQADEAPF